MADVLRLGNIAFANYSTPNEMMGGGRQALVVHKLPGGSRVIDTLGPDEAQVVWRGHFYADDAYDTALALDGMRAAGLVVPLTWGGQFRSVIISEFVYRVARFPVYVHYAIVCTVATNPAFGFMGIGAVAPQMDALVNRDLNSALGL